MAEYIDREKITYSKQTMEAWFGCQRDDYTAMVAFKDDIDKIPAADVRPVVRGEWGYRWKIHGDGRRPTELFPCSECGYENTSATSFCPNCGADMRAEEGE